MKPVSPRKKKIERCLELLSNISAQNYNERCGYDYNYDLNIVPIPGSNNYTLESTESPAQEAHNNLVTEKAKDLEEKEWNELMKTLKSDLRNFWV